MKKMKEKTLLVYKHTKKRKKKEKLDSLSSLHSLDFVFHAKREGRINHF